MLLIQACERQRWAICELEVSLVFEFSEFQGNIVGLSQKINSTKRIYIEIQYDWTEMPSCHFLFSKDELKQKGSMTERTQNLQQIGTWSDPETETAAW